MNKRAQQLAAQAGFNPYNYEGANGVLFKKFAELIVRECANIANAGIDPNEDYLIGNDILEHFGVE